MTVPSQPISLAIQSSEQQVSGALHNCSNLALNSENICSGAEGKICVVGFNEQVVWPWKLSNQAEKSGCIGLIVFINKDDDLPLPLPSHSNSELRIPFVYISREDGVKILDDKIEKAADVEVNILGAGCYPLQNSTEESFLCSTRLPCDTGDFCEYNAVPFSEDQYGEGYCEPCPKDAHGEIHPLSCYFDVHDADTVQNVKSCISSCSKEAEVESNEENCIYCASQLTEFEFGVENESDRCVFCPQDDVQYPDRTVSLFDEHVTCSMLDSFLKRLPVPKGTSNCELIQSVNFMCGCGGTGYAGANSHAKKVALVWVPRVGAILSLMVNHISEVSPQYYVLMIKGFKSNNNFHYRDLTGFDVHNI